MSMFFNLLMAKANSSSPNYPKRGLTNWYDGILNVGDAHSETTTTWKDLIGSGDLPLTNKVIGENYVKNTANSAEARIKIPVILDDDFTLNMVYRPDYIASSNQFLFDSGNVNPVTSGATYQGMGFRITSNYGYGSFHFTSGVGGFGINSGTVDIYNLSIKYSKALSQVTVTINGGTPKVVTANASSPNKLTVFGCASVTYAFFGNLYSIMIYKGTVLTPQEENQIYAINKERFGAI